VVGRHEVTAIGISSLDRRVADAGDHLLGGRIDR